MEKHRCFETVSGEDRDALFQNFYTLESKDLQDSYLAGMITIQDVKQRRSRKQNVNPSTSESTTFAHQGSLFYKVRVTKDGAVVDVPVCRNAFMSFHGITRGRLRTIQASLMSGQSSPRDSRGKHQNRPRSVPEEIHIRSFKPRQSHYSIRNNPRKLYLPETLTIKDMHKMFLDQYHINVPYHVYWRTFNDKFNIAFGWPRSDTCTQCDTLNQQIDASTNNDDKVKFNNEKQFHLSKAEAFYKLKRVSHPSPFKITTMHHQDFHNVKEAVQTYFRKPAEMKAMKLKGLRMYRIDRESPFIGVRDSYSGPWRSINIHNRSAIPQELSFPRMYNEPPKIKPSKIQDLKKLYGLLTPKSRQFFETLPQEDREVNIIAEIDIDNSDNSIYINALLITLYKMETCGVNVISRPALNIKSCTTQLNTRIRNSRFLDTMHQLMLSFFL
ncbi:hypothetical protein C0J52_21668 [Blattella germanica]|nr:hypothetical protein C0J52_21668 [Blattella germanica]